MPHPQAGRLVRAAYEGNAEAVLDLLAQGVPADAQHSSGLQALHFAARGGNTELAEHLMKHGASVNATTQKGNTPLHVAALLGRVEFVKLLLSHGADVNAVSGSNQDSFSALYMAAQIGQQELVTLLLAHGADPDLKTNNGSTAAAVAEQQGHVAVAALLREYSARRQCHDGKAENDVSSPSATSSSKSPNGGVSDSDATPTQERSRPLAAAARLKACAPPVYEQVLPSPKCSPRRAFPPQLKHNA